MTKPTRKYNCRTCGRHRDEVGRMSWTGQCQECGVRHVAENLQGLMTHSGPAFHRWRRAMAASVGGALVDELEHAEYDR